MNNKKLFLFGVVFVIICIFLIGAFSIMISSKNENLKNISIYYYDKLTNNLVSEDKYLDTQKDEFINNLFDEMKIQPKLANLKPIIPTDLQLIGYSIDNNTLNINISNEYYSMSNVEQLVFRAGFVLTVTELDFVSNIRILVEDKPLVFGNNSELLNSSNIILNPFILPDKIEQEQVSLYFANEENMLIEETRNIEFKQNKSMELYIVEELINGPKIEGNIKTIPEETKIRNIKTEDNICYVDLSIDFITKLGNNQEKEKLAIYSIVNSLTNLDNINKVQFLIDGEKYSLSSGSIDISQPIDRYETIIEKED